MPRPIYVPSSKRKPPEYTMGNEYVYADTREEYIGLYIKYPNGTKYTVPSQGNPERELAIMTLADRSPNTSRYAQVTQLQFYKKYEPILHYPTITDKNKEAGFIDRAFAQKINEPDQIIEITVPEAYKASPGNEPSIDTNRYRVGVLQWAIAGSSRSIRDRNAAAISTLERTMPGIKQFLNDLDEFSNSVVNLT